MSVCINAIFVGNCSGFLCFEVLRLIKMENISSIPKKRSLECILGTAKSGRAMTLNGSQLHNLIVRNALTEERNTLKMNVLRELPWT